MVPLVITFFTTVYSQSEKKPDSLKNVPNEAVKLSILLNLDSWVHVFLHYPWNYDEMENMSKALLLNTEE